MASVSRAWLFIITVVSIAIIWGVTLSIEHRQHALNYELMAARVDTIAAYLARQVDDWYRERVNDSTALAAALADRPDVMHALREGSPCPNSVASWLVSATNTYGYSGVLLINRRGVRVLNAGRHLEQHIDTLAARAIQAGVYLFGDIHTHSDGSQGLAYLAPIISAAGRPEGVLVLQVDPDDSLYPSIMQWPIPTQTGETLLIGRDGDKLRILNPLRHRPQHSGAGFPIPNRTELVEYRAMQQSGGVSEGLDYRSEPVLAAYRRLAGTPWAIVCKLDIREVNQRRHSERLFILATSGAITLLVLVLLLVVSNAIRAIRAEDELRIQEERLRARAQEILSQGRYRAFSDMDMVGLAVVSPEGIIQDCNNRLALLLGADVPSVEGTQWTDWFDPGDQAYLTARFGLACRIRAHTEQCEVTLLDRDRSLILALGGVFGEGGQLDHVLLVAQDISELKHAERQIRQSREMLQVVLDTIPLRVYWKDRDLRYLGGNAAFARDAGMPVAALIGRTAHDCPWHAITDVIERDDRMVIETGIPVRDKDVLLPVAGGERILVNMTKVPLRDGDGTITGILGVYADVTDQRRQADDLRRTRDYLETLIYEAGVPIAVWDAEMRFTHVNRAFEVLTGYDRDQLMQTPVSDLFDEVGVEACKTLLGGVPWRDREFVIRRADLDRRWTLWNAVPIRHHMEPVTVIAQVLDITQRRESEQRIRQMSAELTRRNAELSQMLYVASHDMRAPLVNIQGFAKLLREALQDILAADEPGGVSSQILTADVEPALNYIMQASSQMDRLLDGLLRVSRLGRTDLHLEQVAMDHLVKESLEALAFQIEERHADVQVGILPDVPGDVTHLSQVWANLITNAIKYAHPDRKLQIRIWGEQRDGWMVYYIQDNGIGIDPAHVDRVFELYHRLDPGRTEGEGLGLTIARKILDLHNGWIRVWQTSPAGTTLAFGLPAAEDATADRSRDDDQ